MKNLIAYTLMSILCVGLFIGTGIAQAAAAGFQCANCHKTPDQILPSRHVKKNDFSGCFACHSVGKKAGGLSGKVHAVHMTDGKISEQNCLACHPVDANGNLQINVSGKSIVKKADLPDFAQKMVSWVKSDKLVHAHQKKGISCQACHNSYDEDDAYNEKCIACHGNYDAMIQKTAKTKQARNPHKSHYPTLKCTNCHQSHDTFKDFCKTCHGFNFSWSARGN